MKKASLLVITMLALTVFVAIPQAKCGDGKVERWVLLVGGTPDKIGEAKYSHQTLRDTYYFYHLLVYDLGISAEHVMYLYAYRIPPPQILQDYDAIDDIADTSKVRNYITEWLKPNVDEDDIVLIYIATHGRGAFENGTWPDMDKPARIDGSAGDIKDEGDEHYNPVTDTWWGVDEGLCFHNDETIYWDDDFRQDLDELPSCTQIIILGSCFGGGFIDDLSAPNRVIVTAANETFFAYGDANANEFSEFPDYFTDALHSYDVSWDYTNPADPIKHETSVNADSDGNGHVSIQEAFCYAVANDEYDNSWFDCDGNGCPTFIGGADICDEDDINSEPVYLYRTFTLSVSHSSGGYTYPPTGIYTLKEGTVAWFLAFPYSGYDFMWWWIDGGIDYGNAGRYNLLIFEMHSNHFVYACFRPDYGGGGGGGEGCPTLLVWNSSCYVDYGVIDIHNPSGEDVARAVPVQTEDVGISNKATFRLREGWKGLNFSESELDHVKLYAFDSYGEQHLCPLTSAEHSTLGNVKPQLLKSDDVKVQMLLLETVDLTFTVTYQEAQLFLFVIEGCNIIKW